jgi:hypothetical protein
MLEKDIVQAERLPRHESENMSQKESFGALKLYTFVVKQGTTCIAQEE